MSICSRQSGKSLRLLQRSRLLREPGVAADYVATLASMLGEAARDAGNPDAGQVAKLASPQLLLSPHENKPKPTTRFFPSVKQT
jgi:hypothetical protein